MISLALLAYNQGPFIEDAARSALSQEGDPLQIVLSDDCSDDDTFARLERLVRGYAGPHKPLLRRNDANLGIGSHVNELMRAATGELVVWMAGDDVSLPSRVRRTVQTWLSHGRKHDLVASHVFDMTREGTDVGIIRVDMLQRWAGVPDWAAGRPYVIGAGHATTRRLHDHFGPFDERLSYEDQANALRAISLGGALTIDEPLVRYRRGGLSTGRFAPAAFRDFERKRNARHLLMAEQMLRDAKVAGWEPVVQEALEWELRRYRFLADLLDSRTVAAEIDSVLRAKDVSLKFRLSRLLFMRAPRFAAWLRDAVRPTGA